MNIEKTNTNMKKTLLFGTLMALLLTTGCGKKRYVEISNDTPQETVETVVEETPEPSISLDDVPETFYRKSVKAVPVLPSFTKSFGDVMRRTQAEAGFNGIKGYICYCFWDSWLHTSEMNVVSYSTSDYITELSDDSHASVSVHLTMHLSNGSSRSFDDRFELVKSGSRWLIDDIVRDGQSLHHFFKTARPFMP